MPGLSGLSGLSGLAISSGISQFATSPIRTISGIRFAAVPAWNYNQSQEAYSVKGVTAAAADGDPVGQACSYAPDATVYGRAVATARPVVGSGYGQVTHVYNNSELMQFPNSTTQFDWIHKTGIFSFAFFIRLTTAGVAQTVLCNDNATGAKVGVSVQVTAANKVECFVTNGTTTNWDVVTTDTLSASGNGVWVFVRCDGTTMRSRITASGTDTTGAKSGTLASGSASDLMFFGCTSTGNTTKLRAHLGPVLMFDKSLSTTEMSQIEAWVPSRSSSNPFPAITGGNPATTYAWGLWHWYTTAACFTDTGLTTNVSANGDVVNGVKNQIDINRSWSQSRNWVCPGGANTPAIWTSSISNVTVPAPRFNNGRLTDLLKLPITFPTLRNFTYGTIGINLDATNGSHFWHYSGSASTDYCAMTAAAYSGGGPQGPRGVFHTNSSNSIGPSNVNMRTDAHANHIVLQNTGTTLTAYMNGLIGDTTGSGSPTNTLTDTGTTTPDSIGGNGVASTNWNLDGYKLVDYCVPWKMSAADIAAVNAFYVAALGIT